MIHSYYGQHAIKIVLTLILVSLNNITVKRKESGKECHNIVSKILWKNLLFEDIFHVALAGVKII